MKTCKDCSEEKPLEDFHTWKTKDGNSGYRGVCKPCDAKKKQAYYQKNKSLIAKKSKVRYLEDKAAGKVQAYHKNRHLVKTYGITVGEWEDLFNSQGRACAVCRDSDTKNSWYVDHNHHTGEIRGILCNGCNVLIGMAKDHPQVLQDAKNYLEAEGHYGEYQLSLV